MIYIKKFLDKMSVIAGKNKDLILSIDDANGLRDDINKLLIDNYDLLKGNSSVNEPVQVVMKGGKW